MHSNKKLEEERNYLLDESTQLLKILSSILEKTAWYFSSF